MTVQDQRGAGVTGGTVDSLNQQKITDTHFSFVAPYWKEVYDRQDLTALIYQRRRDIVLSLVESLGLLAGSDVLEIGCGAGLTTVELARRGYRVEAMDAVTPMIYLTKRLAGDVGVGDRVGTTLGDAHHLGFRDNAFSMVLAIGVLPWLHSPAEAVREMARVAKPGGYILVSADNVWRLDNVLNPRLNPTLRSLRGMVGDVLRRFGLRRAKSTAPGVHSRSHSVREIDALLQKVGLEKAGGLTLGFGPFSLFSYKVPDSVGIKIHYKLQSLADRRFPVLRSTGTHCIVLARKRGLGAR